MAELVGRIGEVIINEKVVDQNQRLMNDNKHGSDHHHFHGHTHGAGASSNSCKVYNPDQSPPDIDMAKSHGLARRVANSKITLSKVIDVCDCCGLPVENEPLSLCCSRSDFLILGPGFPLYFEFLIFSMVMLFIMVLGSGLVGMITNWRENACNQDDDMVLKGKCTINLVSRISLGSKMHNHSLYKLQSWFILGTAIIIMLAMQLFRRQQRLTERECNQGSNTPSDYSLILRNLPVGGYTESDIKAMLEDYFYNKINISDEERRKGLGIQKIVIAYDIHVFIDLVRKRNELDKKYRDGLRYEKKKGVPRKGVDLKALESEIKTLQTKIDQLEDEAAAGSVGKACGVAFVSFNSQEVVNDLLDRCQINARGLFVSKLKSIILCRQSYHEYLKFKDQLIYVERAPEPNDIFWENLGFRASFKIKRRIITTAATTLLLIICFLTIFGISYIQTLLTEKYKGTKQNSIKNALKILAFVASFLVMFINTGLLIFVRKFGMSEKHNTITYYNTSVAEKLCFAQFFNTALITLLANYFILGINDIFTEGGLASDLFSIFILNAFTGPVMSILNPWWWHRLWVRRKIEKEGSDSVRTQNEAHNWFEGNPIDISQKYSTLVKTMWMTGFYCCVLPLGTLISLAGVICTYWADKYCLLRRNARPNFLSSRLNWEMVEYLEYCPFAMGVGSILFHRLLFPDATIADVLPDLLTIVLASVNFIFPAQEINKRVCQIDDAIANPTAYETARLDFVTEYDRSNPVTKEKAMHEWVEFLEHRGKSKEAQAVKDVYGEVFAKPDENGEAPKKANWLHNYAKAYKNDQMEHHNYFKGGSDNSQPQGGRKNSFKMMSSIAPKSIVMGNVGNNPYYVQNTIDLQNNNAAPQNPLMQSQGPPAYSGYNTAMMLGQLPYIYQQQGYAPQQQGYPQGYAPDPQQQGYAPDPQQLGYAPQQQNGMNTTYYQPMPIPPMYLSGAQQGQPQQQMAYDQGQNRYL